MVEFTVQPRVSGITPEHPAALRAATELYDDLRRINGCSVEDRRRSVDGAKGTASDLILALGGPAVVGSVVAVFRLWLRRDARDRSLLLRRGLDGEDALVEIRGTNVSDQTIRQALDRMLQQHNED